MEFDHPARSLAAAHDPAPVAVAPAAPAPAASVSLELDAEQVANAQVIIAAGRELGVPDRGIAITLGTAMQAVQISAYPDRYAAWEGPATTWLSVLG